MDFELFGDFLNEGISSLDIWDVQANDNSGDRSFGRLQIQRL
ncbi:MAG TPA: hypothetical protein VKI17_12595 [Gemmataceae bacterium]|nr:hypothetical protein [Gemmataceae bacterium]